MNATDDTGATFQDDLAELIRSLTAIARRTYLNAEGQSERHDFGAVITAAVTAAAANLGSVEALLEGRPGSWEADYVRQIVQSVTPEDELHLYRTEPVRLLLDPENVFEALGLQALFEEEDSELSRGYSVGTEAVGISNTDDGASDDAIDDRREKLERAYQADLDAYFTAYVAALEQIVAERGFTVRVEVERAHDYRTEPIWDSLAEDLHAAARDRTPLPVGVVVSGNQGNAAAIDQAVGRAYLDHLRDQATS